MEGGKSGGDRSSSCDEHEPRELMLKVWFPSSLEGQISRINERAPIFETSSRAEIGDLISDVETFFQEYAAKDGETLDFHAEVIWNNKDHEETLSPRDKIGKHFVNGDTFGVRGRVFPMSELEKRLAMMT